MWYFPLTYSYENKANPEITYIQNTDCYSRY